MQGRNRGRAGPDAPGTKGRASQRFELGRFWLWYRADRDDWSICWLEGRVTRRKSTGIGGGDRNSPPEAARDALAEHWAANRDVAAELPPNAFRSPAEVLISDVTSLWLVKHVAGLDAPGRYTESLKVLDRFWTHLDEQGVLPDPLTVASVAGLVRIGDEMVPLDDAFIAWRRGEGASAPTISRDLAALRSPINWAEAQRMIAWAPRIKDVKGKKKPKALEYTPEQIAMLLESARASVERQHVHLFAMIMLSTHARVEATLELNKEDQIRDNLIYFLRPDEDQTRKRRTIVPICPTLAPWLDETAGKVIKYRVPTSEKTRAAGGPDYFERPTANIGNAFAGVVLAAHECRPDLGFARQAIDASGAPVFLPPRKKLGERDARPKLLPVGTPNTLRHTIHTWHKRMGVPDAQIDAAAGHSEQGTGANYTHLRPEYLREFIASTEAFWEAVGEFTDAHLRYQRDTNVASLASARVTR